MTVDFGRAVQDYVTHRAGFPPALFERLEAAGVGVDGVDVLDLGTGTGALAVELAARGGRVTGLDPSARMLDGARQQAAARDVRLTLIEGRAEDTGLPDASFDTVTAGQCWHWMERDRAAAEVARLLRPGGALVIAHLDWLCLPGSPVEVTMEVLRQEARVEAWAPIMAFGHDGIYPQWLRDMHAAGFERLETFSFDVSIPYSRQGWMGRVRASAAVGAVLDDAGVERFDAHHGRALAEHFGPALAIPHRVFAALGWRPAPQEVPA